TITDGMGQGFILDDDTSSIVINNVTQNEGNSGTTAFTFTVNLSVPNDRFVSVNFATANGTATAGTDYVAGSGTLTFAPGEPGQTLTVSVNGDTTNESNETFFVNLSGASNAVIGDNQGLGTITNDDLIGTSVSVTSSANPSVFGQSVTFTATVTPASGTVKP